MKKKPILYLVGMFCLTLLQADSSVKQKVFDLGSSILWSAVDTIGGGIIAEKAFTSNLFPTIMQTLQTGVDIHSAITGTNSFASLNGPLSEDFKQAVQNVYSKNTQTDSVVRVSSNLCPQEQNFINQRARGVIPRLNELYQKYGISADSFSSAHMPRVALCASGGGCRAMIGTQAFLEALKNTGLLDIALYIAVLSGSTWATTPRALGATAEQCFASYKKYLHFTPDILLSSFSRSSKVNQEMKLSEDGDAILVSKDASLSNSIDVNSLINFSQKVSPAKNYLIPSNTVLNGNQKSEVSEIWRTVMLDFYGKRDITAMNFYGAFLAHILGSVFDDPELQPNPANSLSLFSQPRQTIFLSQAADYLQQNNCSNFPLPLASGIAPRTLVNKKRDPLFGTTSHHFTSQEFDNLYQWIEYSPFEVGAVFGDTGAFVPTWAFGRTYYKIPKYVTKTVNITQPQYESIRRVYGSSSQMGGYAPYMNQPHTIHNGRTHRYRPVQRKEYVQQLDGYTITSADPNKSGPMTPYGYIGEYPLGVFQATWGSAFAVSPADLVRILGLDQYTQTYPYFTRILKALKTGLQFTPYVKKADKMYNDFRLFPFTTFNFMQFVDGSPCTDNKVPIIDAGVDFNIPVPLLLRKERKVDVIIVFDASAPVFTVDKNGTKKVDALVGAQQWAARNNCPFPDVINSPEYQKIVTLDNDGRTSQDIFIFKGTGTAPTIIYIPFLDNPANKNNTFKVSECMGESCTNATHPGCGTCSTFNFGYDEKTIKGVRSFINNIFNTDNVKKIVQAIADKSKDKASQGR